MKDQIVPIPKSQVTNPIFNAASPLVYLKFSINKVTAGSINEIADVIAAILLSFLSNGLKKYIKL